MKAIMKAIFALFSLLAISAPALAATPAATPEAHTKAATALPPGHVPIGAAPVDLGAIKVPKASGPEARTVAEIVTKRLELAGKTVLVRGKVVKYTPEVLGKNWLHLRDGTGQASDQSHDILVTTREQTKLGEVVLVKGVVQIDKDIGSGYTFKVLIEEAALQK